MKRPESISVSGAHDLRLLAAAFVRLQMPKSDLIDVLKRSFGRITEAEAAWLDRAWADAVASNASAAQPPPGAPATPEGRHG